MLKRRILVSKQPTDVQYSFSEIIISVDDTDSLHISSWLVGAGGGLVGEWEWYFQAMLLTKLAQAFYPLVMLDSNIALSSFFMAGGHNHTISTRTDTYNNNVL